MQRRRLEILESYLQKCWKLIVGGSAAQSLPIFYTDNYSIALQNQSNYPLQAYILSLAIKGGIKMKTRRPNASLWPRNKTTAMNEL